MFRYENHFFGLNRIAGRIACFKYCQLVSGRSNLYIHIELLQEEGVPYIIT